MDRPSDNEEIRLVAILRTLKKTQEEVADLLKIRKGRVVSIDKWLKTVSLELAEGTIDDHYIKQVVENRLLKLFDEDERSERQTQLIDLVRAARLTADDILQHYRGDYRQGINEYLRKHLDSVQQTAEVLVRLLERLYNFKDEAFLQTYPSIITSVQAWSKWTGKPQLQAIEPSQEYRYEQQDKVDLYLANSLKAHYKDKFGQLPFPSWEKLTVKDISPSLIDNMRIIVHGRCLKFSPSCTICKAIIKGP